MTDYYKHLRENLGTGYFSNMNIPTELKAVLYKELIDKNDGPLSYNYFRNKELSEQDWNEVEKVCRVWQSPLMQALS